MCVRVCVYSAVVIVQTELCKMELMNLYAHIIQWPVRATAVTIVSNMPGPGVVRMGRDDDEASKSSTVRAYRPR